MALLNRYNDIRYNVKHSQHMENQMNEVKMNPKQVANKLVADHMEKLDVPTVEKLRKDMKISQNDAALIVAYVTMQKAENMERLTRVKVKKSKALEAGKETPENK